MKIVLANGNMLPCTEFGYSRLGDILRIEVSGVSLTQAFNIFSNPDTVNRIQYIDDRDQNRLIEEKTGYIYIDSIRRGDDGLVRIALTRTPEG